MSSSSSSGTGAGAPAPSSGSGASAPTGAWADAVNKARNLPRVLPAPVAAEPLATLPIQLEVSGRGGELAVDVIVLPGLAALLHVIANLAPGPGDRSVGKIVEAARKARPHAVATTRALIDEALEKLGT
jgi:hypothetical protein